MTYTTDSERQHVDTTGESQATRKRLHDLLDQILDLREKTKRDTSGEKTPGKHDLANQALVQMSIVSNEATGWALDHLIGYVSTGNRQWQMAHCPSCGMNIDDVSDSPIADDPEFEKHGHHFEPEDARELREVLATIISVTWYASPIISHYMSKLSFGLDALNYGEVTDLLSPDKSGKHGNAYSLAINRLQALEYVYYLVGQGTKQFVAEEIVANALNVSTETLRSWRKRLLPSIFGEGNLAKRLSAAKKVGELKLERQKSGDSATSDSAGIMTRARLEHYEKIELGELAENFRLAHTGND